VDPARHGAAEVGDEPLLLAGAAPAWIARDRAAGARAAAAAGAGALLLDDGLQNPALAKTLSLLVVDGRDGFGNGRLLPAGPLREPVAEAAARCRAAVLMGPDEAGIAGRLAGLPVLPARLVVERPPGLPAGARVLAFAGIGRPAKFFDSCRALGLEVVETAAFPDHHPYGAAELAGLAQRAAAVGAVLVTTAKDQVRLPPAARATVYVVPARLAWADEAAVERLLDEALAHG
jgi:tetraacyldisaccharide 4'-kinase